MADFRYTYDLAMDKVSKKQSLKDLEQFSEAINKISPEISPFSRKDLTRMDRDLKKAKAIISDTFSGQQYVQFDRLNESLLKSGINLKDINSKILKIKRSQSAVTGVAKRYNDLAKEVNTATIVHERLNKFVGTFAKLANFKVAIGAYQFITQQFRQALEFTKELDKTLTEIATVSGASREQLGRYALDFNKMAEEMGRTTNEMAEASVIFFRQGKETAEVMELVEATTVAASIAHTEMAQTSEYLTATLNGFKLEAKEAMSVVDKFSAIAANAGTSFEELAIGLTKVASGARSAGIDIDNMMSYIATVSEATRETATNVGTSFKTIIARFRGITADGHETAATLNSVDNALQSIGINLRDESTGQLRDLQDVLGELGSKWQDLDINTKSYLATVAAGTRQQNRFIALMDNYDRSLEILEISLNSAGAAQAQFGEFSKGIEFTINQLRASLERFWSSLVSSQDIKFLVEGLTKIVKSLTYLAENFSVIALGAIAFNGVLTKIATSLVIGATGVSKINKSMGTQISTVKKLTNTYKVLSFQRNKLKNDKFAREVLSSSEFERYSNGVTKAGEAYAEVTKPLKQATEQMESFRLKSAEASTAVQDFANKYNKVAKGKSLFGKERREEGLVGRRAIDPKTLKVNQDLLNIRLKERGLNLEQTEQFKKDLFLAQEKLMNREAINENLEGSKKIVKELTIEEQEAKALLQKEVSLQQQMTKEIERQRRAVARTKLLAIGTLLAVQTIADAIKESDGSVEDVRDRVLKLTNSLGAMALIMGQDPITKGVGAGLVIASALVEKFWKTNEERVKAYREEIDGLQEDLSTLTDIRDSFEALRNKAARGGIKFLDPEEQKQIYDYMQRIANIDKDLVIDYSIDGRPIIDLTKSIDELIEAQRETVKENREEISSLNELEEAWRVTGQAAKEYRAQVASWASQRAGDTEITNPRANTGGAFTDPYAQESPEQVGEDLEKELEIIAAERTAKLFSIFTFLDTETAKFKKLFIKQFLSIFEADDSVRNEFSIVVEDFYDQMNDALGEAAREGLITEDSANIIINDLLNNFEKSFDLNKDELEFISSFTDVLKNKFIELSEEAVIANISITALLTQYSDFEESTEKLKEAKQKLSDEEDLELDDVLQLVDEYGSLIKYLDLTAENYGITAEAIDEATDIMIKAEIEKAQADIIDVQGTLAKAEANYSYIDSIWKVALAQRATAGYSLAALHSQREAALAEVDARKLQIKNIENYINKIEGYNLGVVEKQDSWTASMHKTSLEFKNMNELLEDSNTEVSKLTEGIKELESALEDADLGTISTLKEHIEAYDKLRGTLTGQLSLQENLKQEALAGLEQVLNIFQDDIPGISLNDLISDGKVDPSKFNEFINFAKEQVNKLNQEIALGRGTKAIVKQIKIYEDLASEVDTYKDNIEKSGIAIDKINDSLDDTREKQQKYYKSILINTLTFIEGALKEKFEEELKELQELHAKNVEQIEEEKEVWDDILEKQKERLNIEKELRDSEKERRDLLKDIGDKQSEINKLALDDSLFAKQRIKELKESLEKDEIKLGEIEFDASFDARTAALEDLDEFKQESFDGRLTELEKELALQEARYEVILNKKNLEMSAELLTTGGEIKTLQGAIIDLDDLLIEVGERLNRTGTREQLEGFDRFQEELKFTQELLSKIGVTYEGVIIDWSQIKSENLDNFEQDIVNSAKLVGDSFSGSLLQEFKDGTSVLVNEVSSAAEQMTLEIGSHANSISEIYRGMVIEVEKAMSGMTNEMEKEADKLNEVAKKLEEAGKIINVYGETEEDKKYTPVKGNTIIPKGMSQELFNKLRDLEIMGMDLGFANGGTVNEDGLAFVHGESSPEWIFNSSQLESVIEMTNMNLIKGLANLKTSDSNEKVIVENLINIEGNATQETVLELKKIAKQIAPFVSKELVTNIKKR